MDYGTMETRVVRVALRRADGSVAAFDENGREIADLSGKFDETRRERILARSTNKTCFRVEREIARVESVTRDDW